MPVSELVLVVMGLLTVAIAEHLLHVSGVMATVSAAVTMGIYSRHYLY